MDYVEQRMAQEAAKASDASGYVAYIPILQASPIIPMQLANFSKCSGALFTPLNVILAAVLGYTIYTIIQPRPKITLAKETPAIVFRTFTPRTLLPYNGEGKQPVYLAVRGRVFDVTSGRNFYGPGGPYANFAGRDASRGLACGSFDEEMLTKDLDGPLDKLEGLGPDEMDALQGWEERFESKYLIVGKLVSASEFNGKD